jgi:hypothetical protein
MEQRKLWLIAGALYVIAAIGAVTLNAASSDGVPRERARTQQPAIEAPDNGDAETDEARDAADTDVAQPVSSDDVQPPTKVGSAVLCSTSEREAIAGAALAERDEVLAQVEDVKRGLLAVDGLGSVTGGAVIPDDVETQIGAIDAAGEAALDEVDATIVAATEACEAGNDPAEILATL